MTCFSLCFLLFSIASFSCKNNGKKEPWQNNNDPHISVKINVIEDVNSTTIVKGSVLNIFKSGSSEPYIKDILINGDALYVKLEKMQRYDFVLSPTSSLASSSIKNLKIDNTKKELNIVQLKTRLQNRVCKAPVLTDFYAMVEDKKIELKDGAILPLPVNAKIFATLESSGGAITKFFNGGFGAKLGIGSAPSSIQLEDNAFLGGLSPTKITNIGKGDVWENTFQFELFWHNMANKKEVDFVLLSYDVVGNRLEHHSLINFDSNEYKKYPFNDINIKNINCNVKTTYSPINLYGINKKSVYYFPSFSFDVEGELAVEVSGVELFRRCKEDGFISNEKNEFFKVADLLYDRPKLIVHKIVDTYGGLFIEKEYEYKIRVLLNNNLYVESSTLPIKITAPFNVRLLSPSHNDILGALPNFSFEISSDASSIQNVFSKNNADYFVFGLIIRSYDGKNVFFNTFKYWLDDVHVGDDKLEILGFDKDFHSFASFKKNIPELANKSSSDIVEIKIETGEVTIKKDALLYTNILSRPFYKQYMPYYWDIASCNFIKKDDVYKMDIEPISFYKKKEGASYHITLSSHATIMPNAAYTSNGNYTFSFYNGNDNSSIINSSYIVKAPDDFSFSFLQKLDARVVDKIKLDDTSSDAYYKIICNSDVDILSDILSQKNIIAAEHDVKIKMIEPIKTNSEYLTSFDFSTKNHNNPTPPLNDPLLLSSSYSLDITGAYKAYKELDFGQNDVIVGIMDTGINEESNDFIDSDGKSIIQRIENNMNLFDDVGHGTHCAGIMAAIGNNGVGIAGVSWQKTKIFPLKFPSKDSFDTYKEILKFIKYVKTQRDANKLTQKTIPFNMSFGSEVPSYFVLDVINKALKEGVLPVVAMGNTGSNYVFYPAAYPGVIAVGSTNAMDEVSSFSTKGEHISIVAPGESIISVGKSDTDSFIVSHGTSMASPFVVGAIAYIMSFNSELTPFQVKTILENTADKIEGDEEFNTKRGYGRINVYKATELAKTNSVIKNKFFNGRLEINIPLSLKMSVLSIYSDKGICIAIAYPNSNGKIELMGLMPGNYVAKLNSLNALIKKEFTIPSDSSDDVFIDF